MPDETMRVQRALARAGVASRRKAEEMITSGRVTVNGSVAKIGQSVNPGVDKIAVDGVRIPAPRAPTWMVLNKPLGTMTTRSDPEGRPTVFEHVPDVAGLTYVGRLDFLTEGVLLLTTDGTGANRLTHPSGEVERVYLATVQGDAPYAAEAAMDGVELSDGPANVKMAIARSLGGGRFEFEVTLAEGRKREVRRLCQELGLTVDRLVRTRFGPVSLGRMASGEARPLTPAERRAIDKLIKG